MCVACAHTNVIAVIAADDAVASAGLILAERRALHYKSMNCPATEGPSEGYYYRDSQRLMTSETQNPTINRRRLLVSVFRIDQTIGHLLRRWLYFVDHVDCETFCDWTLSIAVTATVDYSHRNCIRLGFPVIAVWSMFRRMNDETPPRRQSEGVVVAFSTNAVEAIANGSSMEPMWFRICFRWMRRPSRGSTSRSHCSDST